MMRTNIHTHVNFQNLSKGVSSSSTHRVFTILWLVGFDTGIEIFMSSAIPRRRASYGVTLASHATDGSPPAWRSKGAPLVVLVLRSTIYVYMPLEEH
jgi:hypothetical protein